jgi:hypothetical protein
MLSRKDLGAQGEQLAAGHLVRQGYRLLARNHRTPLGELDVIAQDGPEVVFVEVKTRLDDESLPEESVNPRKVAGSLGWRRPTSSRRAATSRCGASTSWRWCSIVAASFDASSISKTLSIEHLQPALFP